MRIVFIGNCIVLPYSPDHAGVLQSLQILKDKKKIEDYMIADPIHYGRDIINVISEFNPTLVIHGLTECLTRGWPREIHETCPNTKQVMAMWDYRPMRMQYDGLWPTWKNSGQYLDLITISSTAQMGWWQEDFGVKTIYWPHGCVVKDVEYDKDFEYDCVFIGDRNEQLPYKNRVDFIDEIQYLLMNSGVNLTWINQPGGDNTDARIQVWKDLGKIYHSSKTVLDISHFWNTPGYASGRYFYTSGLGGCAITKRFPGCEDLFPEGTKAYFDTPQEAAWKIKYYIDNKKERDIIKKNGKKHANKFHNYTVRLKQLFEELGI